MKNYYIKNFPLVKMGNRTDKTERNFRLVLAPELGNESRLTLIYVSLPPGKMSDYHMHEDNDELMYYLGNAESVIEGVKYNIKKNTVVIVQKGEKHQNINNNKRNTLNILCIFLPAIRPFGSLNELIKITKKYLSR